MELKRRTYLSGNQLGMTVTELMVAVCIFSILAAVAIPSYLNYVQQSRVITLIIPRLHIIETNISLFYSMNNRLPGNDDAVYLLKDIDTEYCDIAITNGSITMKINAPDRSSKFKILHGNVLVASPVISKHKIVSWHLSGELADRLKINY